MAKTWPALVEELAAVLEIRRSAPGAFIGSTADGQRVHGQYRPGDTVGWVALRTPICGQGDMDPTRTLERNHRLAFAVMELADGHYWLRTSLPLDSSELDHPGRLVGGLVEAAETLRPRRPEPQRLD